MTPVTETFGWMANIFFVIGCYLLTQRNTKGFLSNAIANTLYAIQGIIMINPSLVVLSILLTIMNLYGRYKWQRKTL